MLWHEAVAVYIPFGWHGAGAGCGGDAGVAGDVAEGQAGLVDFTVPALHPHSVWEQKQSQVA